MIRTACPVCGTTQPTYKYLFNLIRCRHCKTKLRVRMTFENPNVLLFYRVKMVIALFLVVLYDSSPVILASVVIVSTSLTFIYRYILLKKEPGIATLEVRKW